ncbi:copper resistance protein CopC [Amycolatopsis sp. lyj-108]|uniref:copper resistance CopC family protein n=1 Tax=Amycolatopsis sp. lyj-108 TaxID=2789286 RepID=UPI00397AA58A
MIGRLTSAVLAAAGVVLLGTAPAHATTRLESSDPAEGTSLTKPPAAATLTFSEPSGSFVGGDHLTGPDVTPVSLAAPTAAERMVAQPLPALPNGSFVLSYTLRSIDGHEVKGAVEFIVAAPVLSTTTTPRHRPPRHHRARPWPRPHQRRSQRTHRRSAGFLAAARRCWRPSAWPFGWSGVEHDPAGWHGFRVTPPLREVTGAPIRNWWSR